MRILTLIGIIFCAVLSANLHAAEPTKKNKSKISKPNPAAGPSYAKRHDAALWADKVAQEYQLDAKWIKSQLAQARYIPSIPKLILPPNPNQQKKLGGIPSPIH
jgi:membrane-bound lytic murein transglycosylase B